MQQFLPHILVNHAADAQIVQRLDSGILPPQVRGGLGVGFERMREECIKLQLKASYMTLVRMLQILKEPNGTGRELADEAQELHGRLVDELKYTTCFAVEGRTEQLYRGDRLFGPDVADRFPETGVDIEEAGKCLALDRGTACVFHMMRVLEVALQALALDLKIAKPDRNWQNLLNDIEKALKALPRGTDAEKEYLALRSEAAVHLRQVKDAWRNDVMHPRDTYTVEQAQDVFDHTGAFMRSAAKFLTTVPASTSSPSP